MYNWTYGELLIELRLHLTDARRRIAATAVSIALTEDLLADTLEHLANERPPDAERLRSKATHARLYAARERDRAAMYGYPAPARPPVSGAVTGQ